MLHHAGRSTSSPRCRWLLGRLPCCPPARRRSAWCSKRACARAAARWRRDKIKVAARRAAFQGGARLPGRVAARPACASHVGQRRRRGLGVAELEGRAARDRDRRGERAGVPADKVGARWAAARERAADGPVARQAVRAEWTSCAAARRRRPHRETTETPGSILLAPERCSGRLEPPPAAAAAATDAAAAKAAASGARGGAARRGGRSARCSLARAQPAAPAPRLAPAGRVVVAAAA